MCLPKLNAYKNVPPKESDVVELVMLNDPWVEYTDYGQDLLNARHESFENLLRRFVNLFTESEPLGEIAKQLLPEVDFKSWYQSGLNSGGNFIGSKTLNWSDSRKERLAFQLEVLRHLADQRIPWLDYCSNFAWDLQGNFDSHLKKFNDQVTKPFLRDFKREADLAMPPINSSALSAVMRAENRDIINLDRLEELRQANQKYKLFDLDRLVRLCEEMNTCYKHSAYHGVIMLTRAILDHVPPLFGTKNFTEVANNYSGSKSFREAMEHLSNGARKIADAHLHVQIRPSESLPNATQVDFSQYLDVLLAEIIRIAK
jgi:hypothetical protein